MTNSNLYQVKQIKSKADWESWIQDRPEANFLQSYNWGAFQSHLGKKFFPLALFEGEG
ncbi:MAG: hypothetical protein GF381_02870, partial [Candidatus Pacebacteria bacterium]|nr:hypothetical protein [Candidatus Paceibacterota bacterium]